MAEALENKDQIKDKDKGIECAVCLQKCIHPAQLPCGHIFCFLCIKGFANQNKKCAMCRQEIPRDFTEHPNLLEELVPEETVLFDEGYQWFYEGRNGWWQYDERTSKDLEIYYKKGMKTCELLIAGFLYVVDLQNMLQIRRNDPSRRRKVKRDFATILKKGIAGLHNQKDIVTKAENPENPCANVVEIRANDLVAPQHASSSQNVVEEASDADVYVYEDVEELTGRFGAVAVHPKRH